jgi:hypothetical protein
VEEARARGWEELSNGELIGAAEQAGFEIMVTMVWDAWRLFTP